jgi:hypothetical protein
MGVLGVPLYLGGAIRRIYEYLSRLSIEKIIGIPDLSVLTMGFTIQSNPHTIF